MNENILLNEFKKALESKLAIAVSKIILFGSRISGNAKEYSDYDLLIILSNDYDWGTEDQIYDIAYEIMLKYNIILDVKIISDKELNEPRGKQPYIKNALKSPIFA